jgi:IMP dehydrogenase
MHKKFIEQALTFDDVLLVPAHSKVLPRDVQLKTNLTRAITLNIPLISAAMDTVTEARLAIAMAEEGGIGILHKNMTAANQAAQVRRVKKFESGIVHDPITIAPNASIRELIKLTKTHNISGVPVVDKEQLVGIITNRDIRFAANFDQPVVNLMTPKERLVTAKENTPKQEIIKLLHKHRIEKVLIIDDQYRLRGMITVKDILRAKEKPNACHDKDGRLRVGAAVGVTLASTERINALVAAGVDVLVVDSAHGHAQGVIDRVRWIKKHFSDMQVIAGNIATAEAAKSLAKAGADAIKVGIGPGAICTTRIIAGVGMPQITAIYNVAQVTKKFKIPVIADGGIRFSGDINKALAAGAHSIMMGGVLAGTEESPGEIEFHQGIPYKSYRGMGSIGAMAGAHGSADRYFQENDAEKLVPEGIEGRVPYRGNLAAIIHQLLGGLRSGMGYIGCATIPKIHKKAQFVSITNAGTKESHVHDVVITKEVPNYPQ